MMQFHCIVCSDGACKCSLKAGLRSNSSMPKLFVLPLSHVEFIATLNDKIPSRDLQDFVELSCGGLLVVFLVCVLWCVVCFCVFVCFCYSGNLNLYNR